MPRSRRSHQNRRGHIAALRAGITQNARDIAEVRVPLRQRLQMVVQIQSFALSRPVIEPDALLRKYHSARK